MIIFDPYYNPPVNYKDYKNRTRTKHLDKIKNQMRQISDCSLKGEDKQKLLQDLKAEIESKLIKK